MKYECPVPVTDVSFPFIFWYFFVIAKPHGDQESIPTSDIFYEYTVHEDIVIK